MAKKKTKRTTRRSSSRAFGALPLVFGLPALPVIAAALGGAWLLFKKKPALQSPTEGTQAAQAEQADSGGGGGGGSYTPVDFPRLAKEAPPGPPQLPGSSLKTSPDLFLLPPAPLVEKEISRPPANFTQGPLLQMAPPAPVPVPPVFIQREEIIPSKLLSPLGPATSFFAQPKPEIRTVEAKPAISFAPSPDVARAPSLMESTARLAPTFAPVLAPSFFAQPKLSLMPMTMAPAPVTFFATPKPAATMMASLFKAPLLASATVAPMAPSMALNTRFKL